MEECTEMSSRWDVTLSLMNSKQMWLPAEDGGHQHPIRVRGGTHEAPPFLKEFLVVNVCWERGIIFLSDVVIGK